MNSYDLDSVHANALDSRHLTQLRGAVQGADGGSREAVREVAEQFESLFVQTMLKRMRATLPEGGMFDGPGMDQYQSLFDQQLASDVARGQGMGLADMVERQILQSRGLTEEGPGLDRGIDGYSRLPARPLPGELQARAGQIRGEGAPAPGSEPVGAAPPPRIPAEAGTTGVPNTPEAFAQTLWPLAQRTGRELGVPPEALVAQAALETGWGQHVLRGAEGASSHNVFNIKAHRDWDGPTVGVPTLEYRDGVAVREHAQFRAYESLEAAFRDYADFLRSHPRYTEALRSGDDPDRFIRALQDAGYATDPAYADKVGRILRGDTLSALKNGGGETTT
ncbi:flagellar assembly peptidoglycan hydrolase FlgJ [Sediminicurvatus halobius]|uniref:Peptidoglycan hydrolase FlgJ n=1 Tax=Sediminicurvatus halobius TaxID=2182432 RepID=A0A2U2MZF6_9GAMM|nr:flagellar assembly peptidoglycan hydrolase FlgJ [Spiribacter halobius]PWG62306.1 flagellar assembly peptidoglycan hydrolase FlgJ [Spiribacter halobius]UEX79773.1 flagellar assembly peptidoglycan hydrolase FlgJ [Spiribacter halobius]